MAEPILAPTVADTLAAIDRGADDLAGCGAQIPGAWLALTDALTARLRAALAAGSFADYREHEALARRLYAAGRNACWALARAATDIKIQHAWQRAALGHERLLRAFATGWPRLQPMRNPRLPMEYNGLAGTPKRPLITGEGESYLLVLLQDPLGLAAADARTGLVAVPAGVFLSGTFGA